MILMLEQNGLMVLRLHRKIFGLCFLCTIPPQSIHIAKLKYDCMMNE